MTQSPEEKRRRNLEAVNRFNERDRAGLTWEDTDGPAMIGEVKPLAPGAINPMWAIEERLYSEKKGYGIMVKRGHEALKATEAKQRIKRNISVEGPGLYLTRTIEVDPDLMA